MFTGIVKGIGRVDQVDCAPGLASILITLPSGAESDLEQGASVAVDGVCLSVSKLLGSQVTFDVMQETLTCTTLGRLTADSKVNIERAAKDGAENGGHAISGHVDCVATIIKIDRPENNIVMTIGVSPQWLRYIFNKGYIALNGTSLTISGLDKAASTFQVWFIPETLRLTTFGEKIEGDCVNIEVDRGTQVVVDTIRDFLEERLGLLKEAVKISPAALEIISRDVRGLVE